MIAFVAIFNQELQLLVIIMSVDYSLNIINLINIDKLKNI